MQIRNIPDQLLISGKNIELMWRAVPNNYNLWNIPDQLLISGKNIELMWRAVPNNYNLWNIPDQLLISGKNIELMWRAGPNNYNLWNIPDQLEPRNDPGFSWSDLSKFPAEIYWSNTESSIYCLNKAACIMFCLFWMAWNEFSQNWTFERWTLFERTLQPRHLSNKL